MMLASDCKKIYKGKDYHRKRLKTLEKERYIRRINKLYIKLDDKGTRLVKEFGYNYSFACRRDTYLNRLNETAKIAGLTINTNIDFIASWNIKDRMKLTQKSRKYLGKIIYQGKEVIVYYISKDKEIAYISQIINDIQKIIDCNDIIIFIENMKILNKKQSFIFGNKNTIVIKPTEENLSIIRKLIKIDFYQIVRQIYNNKEILLSNWEKAQYMTEDENYIVLMPFINTEEIYKLNIFDKKNPNRKIDILTLKENKEKIEEMLINKINIIEMDDWLGGNNEIEQEG